MRQRKVHTGFTGSGKTAQGKKLVDAWLMDHPGKKALILDPKSKTTETRHFEPNLQIAEKKEANES
jgi:hypothetical protein